MKEGLGQSEVGTSKVVSCRHAVPIAVRDASGRLFVRLKDEKDPFRSQMPVVGVVAMKAEEWKMDADPCFRGFD